MKIVSDGSPQQETAFQPQPYLNSTSTGHPNYTADELNALVRKVKPSGWPALDPLQRGRFAERALDALEAAYGSRSGAKASTASSIARSQIPSDRPHETNGRAAHIYEFVYYYGAAYRDSIFGAPGPSGSIPPGIFWRREFRFRSIAIASSRRSFRFARSRTAVTRICSTDGSVIGPQKAFR